MVPLIIFYSFYWPRLLMNLSQKRKGLILNLLFVFIFFMGNFGKGSFWTKIIRGTSFAMVLAYMCDVFVWRKNFSVKFFITFLEGLSIVFIFYFYFFFPVPRASSWITYVSLWQKWQSDKKFKININNIIFITRSTMSDKVVGWACWFGLL